MKRRNLMIRTSHKLLEHSIIGNIISDRLGIGSAVIYLNNDDPFIMRALSIFRNGQAFPKAPGGKKTAYNNALPNQLLWIQKPYDFQKRVAMLYAQDSEKTKSRKA